MRAEDKALKYMFCFSLQRLSELWQCVRPPAIQQPPRYSWLFIALKWHIHLQKNEHLRITIKDDRNHVSRGIINHHCTYFPEGADDRGSTKESENRAQSIGDIKLRSLDFFGALCGLDTPVLKRLYILENTEEAKNIALSVSGDISSIELPRNMIVHTKWNGKYGLWFF